MEFFHKIWLKHINFFSAHKRMKNRFFKENSDELLRWMMVSFDISKASKAHVFTPVVNVNKYSHKYYSVGDKEKVGKAHFSFMRRKYVHLKITHGIYTNLEEMFQDCGELRFTLQSRTNATGCPTYLWTLLKGYNSKTKPFWQLVGKAKMRFRPCQYF